MFVVLAKEKEIKTYLHCYAIFDIEDEPIKSNYYV